MNPYETLTSKIPKSDVYGDVPLYGRYRAHPDDFLPESRAATDIQYWDSLLDCCTPETRIYGDGNQGRDIFAVGGIIVHSAHLQPKDDEKARRTHSYGDANDVATAKLVNERFPEIPVPRYYFQGMLRGCHVLVQQRIAGVGLNVAWPYLSSNQKQSFKDQTRSIMLKLLTITDHDRSTPTYVVEDADPCTHRGIQERERRILFDAQLTDDLGLAHNDLNWSNIIVNEDAIVGVLDWEMAGWFGRDRPANVHRQIRMPDRGTYSHLPGMTEERLGDLLYWNDLYDF